MSKEPIQVEVCRHDPSLHVSEEVRRWIARIYKTCEIPPGDLGQA
jgi:hypothetical protein